MEFQLQNLYFTTIHFELHIIINMGTTEMTVHCFSSRKKGGLEDTSTFCTYIFNYFFCQHFFFFKVCFLDLKTINCFYSNFPFLR